MKRKEFLKRLGFGATVFNIRSAVIFQEAPLLADSPKMGSATQIPKLEDILIMRPPKYYDTAFPTGIIRTRYDAINNLDFNTLPNEFPFNEKK